MSVENPHQHPNKTSEVAVAQVISISAALLRRASKYDEIDSSMIWHVVVPFEVKGHVKRRRETVTIDEHLREYDVMYEVELCTPHETDRPIEITLRKETQDSHSCFLEEVRVDSEGMFQKMTSSGRSAAPVFSESMPEAIALSAEILGKIRSSIVAQGIAEVASLLGDIEGYLKLQD